MKLSLFGRKEKDETSSVATTPTKGTILLCESDPFYSEAITVLLKQAGYGVIVATDSAQALTALKATPRILLVLCEVDLSGQDGYALLHDLKADPVLKQVPFIFLTSEKSITNLERARELGAKDYFIKAQAGLSHLLELIQKYT